MAMANADVARRPSTLSVMSILAVAWHFWIAVPLAAVSVVAVLGTIGGYLAKVTYSRYPRD